MNYVSFCRMYFSVTHIPVSLMKKNEAIYSSIGEVCSVKAARYWEMAPIDDTPNFYRYSPDIEYGVVHILGTDYAIVLGPAFSVPVTSEIIRTYMHENAIAIPRGSRRISLYYPANYLPAIFQTSRINSPMSESKRNKCPGSFSTGQ